MTGSVKTLMSALAKSNISADLESVISTISSIVNLHDQQKVLRQSKPVEISQWRQSTCNFNVAIGWANKRNLVCVQTHG